MDFGLCKIKLNKILNGQNAQLEFDFKFRLLAPAFQANIDKEWYFDKLWRANYLNAWTTQVDSNNIVRG